MAFVQNNFKKAFSKLFASVSMDNISVEVIWIPFKQGQTPELEQWKFEIITPDEKSINFDIKIILKSFIRIVQT